MHSTALIAMAGVLRPIPGRLAVQLVAAQTENTAISRTAVSAAPRHVVIDIGCEEIWETAKTNTRSKDSSSGPIRHWAQTLRPARSPRSVSG